MRKLISLLITLFFAFNMTYSQELQTDKFKTSMGDLSINFVKHASLFFEFNGIIIHVDPVSRMGNYEKYPDADLILITHEHGDHFDLNAIELIKKENTKIVFTNKCKEMSENISNTIVMQNGDILNINQLEIEAISAYNIKNKRDNGKAYHPKGDGNGYIIKFGDKKVYIAGDTENTPEMKTLKDIYIAFLPMNLPYTMTPEMLADAAKAFRPKILYPYHYSNTDTSIIIDLLKDEKHIDVRIKKM